MKKKRLLTTLVSIVTIFMIAGCSSSNNSGQASAASNNGNGNGSYSNGNRPAFQKPDVYGEVSTISGNKVTLKLLKIPQMMGRNRQGGGNGSGNGSGGGNWGNGNGNGGGNGNGNGGGFRRSGGFGGMRAKQYTGEVKTIDIPSGVPLTTMTFGQNGMTQSNISLSQVPTGSVLSIYYNTDGKTIKSIRVQQPRTGNGQQTGNSGNGQQSGNNGN